MEVDPTNSMFDILCSPCRPHRHERVRREPNLIRHVAGIQAKAPRPMWHMLVAVALTLTDTVERVAPAHPGCRIGTNYLPACRFLLLPVKRSVLQVVCLAVLPCCRL